MKLCPYCGKEYSDEVSLCAVDGLSLETVVSVPPIPSQLPAVELIEKSLKAAPVMSTWLRWIFLVLSIGGGFTGLVAIIESMSHPEAAGLFEIIVCGIFVVLYIFTIVSGLLLAENPRCIIPLMVVQAFQIPWVSSPIFSYSYSSGFRFIVGLVGGGLSASYGFGSDFQFFILRNRPWGIGVNLFAVVALILLAKYRLTHDNSPKPPVTVSAN